MAEVELDITFPRISLQFVFWIQAIVLDVKFKISVDEKTFATMEQ